MSTETKQQNQAEPTAETMETINALFNEAVEYFEKETLWDMFKDSIAGSASIDRDALDLHNRAHYYRILEQLFEKIKTVPYCDFSTLSIHYTPRRKEE